MGTTVALELTLAPVELVVVEAMVVVPALMLRAMVCQWRLISFRMLISEDAQAGLNLQRL